MLPSRLMSAYEVSSIATMLRENVCIYIPSKYALKLHRIQDHQYKPPNKFNTYIQIMYSPKISPILTPLFLLCTFLTIIDLCAGADFDAKSQFAYIDSSCADRMDRINDAGDDYNKLVQAALDSVPSIQPATKLGKLTLKAYLKAELAIGLKGTNSVLCCDSLTAPKLSRDHSRQIHENAKRFQD